MVAYVFQTEFVAPILAREKTSTLRMRGKKRHAREAEVISLWHAQRTPQRIKFGSVLCARTHPCILEVEGPESVVVRYRPGVRFTHLASLALLEGFKNQYQLAKWFYDRYGAGRYEMIQIVWAPDEGVLISPEDFENGDGLNQT